MDPVLVFVLILIGLFLLAFAVGMAVIALRHVGELSRQRDELAAELEQSQRDTSETQKPAEIPTEQPIVASDDQEDGPSHRPEDGPDPTDPADHPPTEAHQDKSLDKTVSQVAPEPESSVLEFARSIADPEPDR